MNLNTQKYNKDKLFTEGAKLLTQWQSGNEAASLKLKTIFDDVIEGRYDSLFKEHASTDVVNIRTSLHMTTLTLLNQLYSINSNEFYKGDSKRYVRTTLITTYPDRYAPSVAVGNPLINKLNWENIKPPNMNNDIIRIIDEMMSFFTDLTNEVPIVHLPAPYSLVADIYGQEKLIMALMEDPQFVEKLLDHVTRQVFVPWCNHFIKKFPDLQIEFSDASGSPNFIGPDLFKNAAALPVLYLINNYPWGNRIFVANYRGDAYQKTEKDKININGNVPKLLAEIIDIKLSVCPGFIIKLEADKEPLSFYEEQAVIRKKPLHLGIGAIQIDRNNNLNKEDAKKQLITLVKSYTTAIKNVSKRINLNTTKDDTYNKILIKYNIFNITWFLFTV